MQRTSNLWIPEDGNYIWSKGSGRTSILNAVASQSSNPFISDYWPMDNDPVKNMVTQVAAHFIGHNLPSVISETITRLSEELDNKDGPIPLVASTCLTM